MSFDTFSPLVYTERLIAIAVILQSIELLQLRRFLSESGIWRWSILRSEYIGFPKPVRYALDTLLEYRAFIGLLNLRILGGFALWVYPGAMLSFLLFASTLLICLRFRGTFNGGSDYMTVIVLGMLSLARAFEQSPIVAAACLLYIAIQCCLSYFISGVAKLKTGNWRTSAALLGFLKSSAYATQGPFEVLERRPAIAKAISAAIIGFECSFPLALFNPTLCLGYIGFAVMFHLANIYIFGLNRFFFAWTATYPALYLVSIL